MWERSTICGMKRVQSSGVNQASSQIYVIMNKHLQEIQVADREAHIQTKITTFQADATGKIMHCPKNCSMLQSDRTPKHGSTIPVSTRLE